jgi:HTH-type transcriptional regulator / antitoxin HigA
VKTQRDRYLELVLQFPLRPIRSDEELNGAIAMIDSLLDKVNLNQGERDYLDVLSDLVKKYESEHHPIPRVEDSDLLRHLLEVKGTTQSRLAQDTGIAESTISEILSGKRSLNRAQIGKLSRYFHVEAGVFNFEG